MNADALETHILKLWTTTKLPLTIITVTVTSGVPRAKVEKQLDAMTVSGLLDMDTDNEGNLSWSVKGEPRSKTGPSTLAEWESLGRITREIAKSSSSRNNALTSGGGERKSITLSTILSLLFGGFGLLYAAPMRVAIPAILAQTLLVSLLPHNAVVWVLSGVQPFLGLAGALYAWAHNKRGHRATLKEAFIDNKKLLGK